MNSPQKGSSRLPMAQEATRNVSVVDTSGLAQPLAAAASSVEDDAQSLGVIAAPVANVGVGNPQTLRSSVDGTVNNVAPDQIPVEESTAASCNGNSNGNCISNGNGTNKSEEAIVNVDSEQVEGVNVNVNVTNNDKSVDSVIENDDDDDHSCDDDESEYEYEDEDGAAFSGFLMTDNTYGSSSTSINNNSNSNSNSINNNNNNNNNNTAASSSTLPARIVEEESLAAVGVGVAASASATASRKKWREPSRAAVSMSLRAQQETSGSKRRLAQDLYRIMNQDTEEAGFSIAPKSEDCMKMWTIKLFQFDPDSNLAKDMLVVGIDHIELEMKFPEQYPFEPPFVRVVKPRFKRQTGFVMNGALCMELLTKEGWNAVNDIESVIVSIRSLLVVGDGRLQAATDLTKTRYETLLATAQLEKQNGSNSSDSGEQEPEAKKARTDGPGKKKSGLPKSTVGSYTENEAQSAYSHLSDYHKKKGWDNHGWWARKG